MVVSQDTSAYGVDIKYQQDDWQGKSLQTRFYDLAEALGELGIWVRMHYVYPYPHVDNIIPLMAAGKVLAVFGYTISTRQHTYFKTNETPGGNPE